MTLLGFAQDHGQRSRLKHQRNDRRGQKALSLLLRKMDDCSNAQIISAVHTQGHKRFSTAMTIATDRPAARASQIFAELEGAAHTWHKSRHLSDRHSKTFIGEIRSRRFSD
jgi:hypothetical protein